MNNGPGTNAGGRAGQLIPAPQSGSALPELYGSLAGYQPYPAATTEGPELFGLNLLEIWRILNKRKWLILGIVAAAVMINGVRTLMQTPIYTATVRLQIDRPMKIVESGNDVVQQGTDWEFMKTQYELLGGYSMAERVAIALKLGAEPDFFKPRQFSIFGLVAGLGKTTTNSKGKENELQRAAAGVVLGNVAINPVPESRLIDVSYSDPVPQRAQRVANAYADAFVATNTDKRFQANAQAKLFLEDKIDQLKLRLEESENKLLQFAQDRQIVDITDKTSIAESNLASTNSALGNLISERTKNEQLWNQVEAANEVNIPQLLSNSVIDGLRKARNSLLIEYQEKLQTFKPGYPEMVRLSAKIKEIDEQIAKEVTTTKQSLKAAYESSLTLEEKMQKRVTDLKKEVLGLQQRSIEYNILKREVDTNRELYTSLLQRYKEVDVASGVGTNNVFVVDRANEPSSPSSPNLSRSLVLALVFGFGSALAAAYVLERLDDKIKTPEQVELHSGIAMLGVIPAFESLETVDDPRSAHAEAYRSLGTALLFSTESGLPKTLAITSTTPSEGKSSTAVAIAKHFATIGRKVLLIDADLRNPSLHTKLGCDNSMGLSNCLTGACKPPDCMQKTALPNLAFIPSGPLPPNAADLLGGARLLSLLSVGSEVFDIIIIDGPPVMHLADAQLLTNAASATIFVVGSGQTRPGALRAAIRQLQLTRGSIVGAVLTKYDPKRSGYGYGYSYGYSYGYGEYGAYAEPKADDPPAHRQPQLADLRERLASLAEKA